MRLHSLSIPTSLNIHILTKSITEHSKNIDRAAASTPATIAMIGLCAKTANASRIMCVKTKGCTCITYAELKELTEKKDKLSAEITDITEQIASAMPTDNVPSVDESNELKAQIAELEKQKAGLGIFAGKEKKRIGEEIAAIQGRVDSLQSKIEEEENARNEAVEKKTAPLEAKKAELEKQLSDVTKRVSAIKATLTKDPKE